MPEGPLLVLWKEQLQPFIGRQITGVENNTKLDAGSLPGATILDIKTWGKHLLFCFEDSTLRVHFSMFGDLFINRRKPPEKSIKLSLQFGGDELVFYNTTFRFLQQPLDAIYDWSADVMNDAWNPGAAMQKLAAMQDVFVCDALLNQEIFAGVGNVIKNEVLFAVHVQPLSLVGNIPVGKWTEIMQALVQYSFQLVEWRRRGEYQQHWQANGRKWCPRDHVLFTKAYLGTLQRRSYYCTQCQVLY